VRGINDHGWKECLKGWKGHIYWSFERCIEFGAAFVWHWHFKELDTHKRTFYDWDGILRYPLS
jgi:hypothetical protein